ncbi:MAG: heme utilization cystosolic carrier protein HutX [Rhizobiales bacterium]|nr:heme utilization cystosolic carrier protein HutX [Hyphomicrobiales bacterium]
MNAPSINLHRHMAENPGAVFETVASEYSVTPRAAVEALPAEMRRLAPGEAFIDAMNDVATWGGVTLIIHTDDGIMEFTGSIPAGQVGRGYFNLTGSTGFHGHLRHERCAGLAFVERPFMSKLSAVIVFFNCDGGIMFKVFVGRDENRELKTDQLAAFRALADRLCRAEMGVTA